MNKVKTILLRLFFYFIAIQILNLSIDFDYLRCSDSLSSQSDNYDDIDSYAEFIVETIAGNDHLISENDDDNGQAKNVVKITNIVLYAEQIAKLLPQVPQSADLKTFWTTGLDQRNKICKGYFSIVTPPPKA
jgi:hypothetical protein